MTTTADPSADGACTTIPEFIRWIAARSGDREAIVLRDHRMSYADLDRESRILARGLLARGVTKGSHVGVWMGNGPEWLTAWAAITRVGAVAVPISTFAQGRELARVVRHADLQGILMLSTFAGYDLVERLAAAVPEVASATSAELVLGAVPFLRFVVLMDNGPTPVWARDAAWVGPSADLETFDDDLLTEIESEVDPLDAALMIYTSGSTSDPKGVMHSHETVLTKAFYLRDMFGFPSDERSLTTHPFFWVGGLVMSLLPALAAGGTQICVDRFDPAEILEVIERERVTRAGFYVDRIPSMLAQPGFATLDRSSLRVSNPELLTSGGFGYGRARGGLEMGLGMSETFGPYWWGRMDPGIEAGPIVPGGRFTPPLDELQPGMELIVVDPDGKPVADGETGEICIRGSCITIGLYKVPRDRYLSPDGFFRTGDSGEVRGTRVYFRGRINDMIKTAGANVAPAEVVAALMELDGVSAAHVVGLADPLRGQVVAAAVVPDAGASLDPDAMRAELRRQMSSYKVPTHIVILDEAEIPWNEASNKLRARDLKNLLADRVASEWA